MSNERTDERAGRDTPEQRTRRRYLAALGSGLALGLAGCSGGGGGSGTTPTSGGGSGTPTGTAGGGRGTTDRGTGTTNGDDLPQREGVVGQRIAAPKAPVELMVEEVTPVDSVKLVDSQIATNYPDRWGRSIPFEEWVEESGTDGIEGFWAIRVAVKNVGDGVLNNYTHTTRTNPQSDMLSGVLPAGDATSQRRGSARGSDIPTVVGSGEVYRYERVVALKEEPGPFQVKCSGRYFDGSDVSFANFTVDLSSGSAATAPFTDEVTPVSVGETVRMGALELTPTEFVYEDTAGEVAEQWSQPRENFHFAKVTVDATRVADPEITWGLGLKDGEGHRYFSDNGLDDAYDLERPRISKLEKGETREDYTIVYAVEKGWEPETLYAVGPQHRERDYGSRPRTVYVHGFWQ